MGNSVRNSIDDVRAYRRGDIVTAVRHLGKKSWCSGVPAGTVGEVVDIDWLGDLRVEFTLDGDWLARRSTVEKVVASCDLRLVRATRQRLTSR